MVENNRGAGARKAVRLATAKAVRATDMAMTWRGSVLSSVRSKWCPEAEVWELTTNLQSPLIGQSFQLSGLAI